jgi:hypothetical protein
MTITPFSPINEKAPDFSGALELVLEDRLNGQFLEL